MNIYWSVPAHCFGDISYQIINDDTAKMEEIEEIPFVIPLSAVPTAFPVVTVTEFEDQVYESEPSVADSDGRIL